MTTLKELTEKVPRKDWDTTDIYIILPTPMRGTVRRLEVKYVHCFAEPAGYELELTAPGRWSQEDESV